MRFTCTIPDTLFSELETRYGGNGRTNAATVAAALDDLVNRGDDLCRDPDHQTIIADHQRISAECQAIISDRDQARDRLAAAVLERDRLMAESGTVKDQAHAIEAEVERLRAELAARDQLLGEKSDEIRWLRGEVSKLNDKLTPIAIAETSGAGRRAWWAFWRPRE